MLISKKQISHLAELSRLKLSSSEIEKMSAELTLIIGYFDELQEVNTDKVIPWNLDMNSENVFREDKVIDSLSQKEALGNAPHTDGEYFLVPKVIG